MNINNINLKLSKNIKKYNLPQAIRVISYYLKQFYPNETYENLYKKVNFKSNASLSFQKSEISNIKFYEDEIKGQKVEVTLNFLGLFGSSSPLPSHYNEAVLESFDTDKVLYDFLNLFNNNLQKFIYPIWQKQRYYIEYKKDLKDKFSKYMLSLLGLYSNIDLDDNKLDFHKLMPYIGILSMRQKSAGTLVSILRHYLDFDEIEILQCMKMQSIIPSWQYGKLGEENSSLGQNMMIGEFVTNRTSKFRILLKNVKASDMYKYSIHGVKRDELKDLISFAFNEPLEYDVCLEIKKENKIPLELDEEDKRYLGINCWIGNAASDEQIIIAQKG